MKKYIWQNSKYPNFTYDKELIIPLLSSVRLKQGMLLGKMQQLGFENSQYAVLNILTEDVIKSSEIEGLKLNTEQVRSSIAKRLGLDIGDDIYIERDVQGTVDMMLDATQYFDKPLTEDRLFGWQSAMFPSGRSGLYKIKVGEYRDDANGAMQVVSGAVGHEKVHYEAPPANSLDKEMKTFLDYINNEKETDLVIKTAIAHLWFVIIHPFEDGNGRIARLMVNFILTRHDYPMIVVRSRKKSEYLEALHQVDLEVGPVPSDGAHADIKDIRPFLKYFNDLVATEVYNDVLFVSEKNENVWWYDGERIAFRTPNYTKILNAMRTYPTLTLADMKEITGISIAAIQKLLDQLIQKKYVERGEKDGSWRVFVVQ